MVAWDMGLLKWTSAAALDEDHEEILTQLRGTKRSSLWKSCETGETSSVHSQTI